jgi:hypothetical protein
MECGCEISDISDENPVSDALVRCAESVVAVASGEFRSCDPTGAGDVNNGVGEGNRIDESKTEKPIAVKSTERY